MTNYLTIALWQTVAAAGSATSSGVPYGKLYAGVFIVGFVAAVSLGSIAFYNSKRPVGWENKDRPGYVPKIDTEETK